MNKEKYFPPKHATGGFHCSHCGVYAKQRWSHLRAVGDNYSKAGSMGMSETSNIYKLTKAGGDLSPQWTISFCEHCGDHIIWLADKIIYPKKIIVDQPNLDLTVEIKKDYFEAARVLDDSPRSAAAILRLALQKLCQQLGEKGKNINEDIKVMVQKGLSPVIQKSLDALRITGNNAVHPGELDLSEDKERVLKLFQLINFIAEKMITDIKEINSFYEDLPNQAKVAVEKRDAKTVQVQREIK